MIYTASFEAFREFNPVNTGGVSIARRVPTWCKSSRWNIREYRPLAPQYWFDKTARGEARDYAWQDFIEYYLLQLERLDPVEVLRELREKVSKGETIALLCWEREPACCHRRLVGEWLEREAKQIVIEL